MLVLLMVVIYQYQCLVYMMKLVNGLLKVLVYTLILKDRKSTRLNSSHVKISYAVFCLKKKRNIEILECVSCFSIVLCDASLCLFSVIDMPTTQLYSLSLHALFRSRTWGGLVGISGNARLVDGGYISVPMFGVYDETGKWIIEGVGVYPDIE